MMSTNSSSSSDGTHSQYQQQSGYPEKSLLDIHAMFNVYNTLHCQGHMHILLCTVGAV